MEEQLDKVQTTLREARRGSLMSVSWEMGTSVL